VNWNISSVRGGDINTPVQLPFDQACMTKAV